MNLLRKGMFVLLGLGITVACSDDDDKAIDNNGGGSSSAITNVDFTLTASDDTRTGTVTPSSDGGTLYTVDFGDASTEDDNIQTSGPAVSYTYPAANADYVISVTASASGAEDVTVTKNHTVTVPDVVDAAPFAGSWKLAPEAAALGVGPEKGNLSWWSNSEADVTTRACLFDDTFEFGADGSFANNMGETTWVEGWQGAEEGCAAPIYPYDGKDTSFTYTYNESAQTITVNGEGAHIGLAKAYNDGEWNPDNGNPFDAAAVAESVTYNIVEMTDTRMTLDVSIGGGYWTFILIKDGSDNGGGNNGGGTDASGLEGSWSLSPEAAAIGVGPEKGNLSWWSNSEADVTTRACLFDDTFEFGADGSFANNMGETTWVEGWQGAEEGCAAPIYPYDGKDTSFTYTYNESAQTITVNGEGAHIGLAKAYNDGEWNPDNGNPFDAAAVAESVTYNIVEMTDTKMTLDVSIGGGYWTYILVKN